MIPVGPLLPRQPVHRVVQHAAHGCGGGAAEVVPHLDFLGGRERTVHQNHVSGSGRWCLVIDRGRDPRQCCRHWF
jgi:hypothetical protein